MFVLDWLGRRAAPLITRLGLTPRTVTLETIGRTSGKPRRVSVTVARLDGRRYLVGLGGDATPWVRNVRAADGRAVILSGRRQPVRLAEVPIAERAPVLVEWVTHRAFTHSPESSARTFFGFDHIPDERELVEVADRSPVFRIDPA